MVDSGRTHTLARVIWMFCVTGGGGGCGLLCEVAKVKFCTRGQCHWKRGFIQKPHPHFPLSPPYPGHPKSPLQRILDGLGPGATPHLGYGRKGCCLEVSGVAGAWRECGVSQQQIGRTMFNRVICSL